MALRPSHCDSILTSVCTVNSASTQPVSRLVALPLPHWSSGPENVVVLAASWLDGLVTVDLADRAQLLGRHRLGRGAGDRGGRGQAADRVLQRDRVVDHLAGAVGHQDEVAAAYLQAAVGPLVRHVLRRPGGDHGALVE